MQIQLPGKRDNCFRKKYPCLKLPSSFVSYLKPYITATHSSYRFYLMHQNLASLALQVPYDFMQVLREMNAYLDGVAGEQNRGLWGTVDLVRQYGILHLRSF